MNTVKPKLTELKLKESRESFGRASPQVTVRHVEKKVESIPASLYPKNVTGKNADVTESAGNLKAEHFIELHSKLSKSMWYGRPSIDKKKPGIIGAVGFGTLSKNIWSASAKDDPFADKHLLTIEERLNDARHYLQNMLKQLDKPLKKLPSSIHIGEVSSNTPLKIPMAFGCPLGFMGAYLVADYDAVVCKVHSLRHVSLIDRRDAELLLHDAGHHVRGVFHAAAGYKNMMVTREDMRQNNARAKAAIEKMGELSEAIISGELRAGFAPKIRAVTMKADAESVDE